MGDALGRHRAHGRHQGLAEGLAAEHALPGLLRAAAAKQVILQRLQVQNGEQVLDGAGRLGFAWRHDTTRDDSGDQGRSVRPLLSSRQAEAGDKRNADG